MYEDLLGPRPDKPKEPNNKINLKDEEEKEENDPITIDEKGNVIKSSGSGVSSSSDPWGGDIDDDNLDDDIDDLDDDELDIDDLEDLLEEDENDDCDGCDGCDSGGDPC
jgi:ribonuclease E